MPLRRLLEAHADPERAIQEARYLKLETREVIGATVPATHTVAVEFTQTHRLPTDLDLIDRWFHASFEEVLCAIEFLAAQPAYTRRTWSVTEG